MKKHIVLVSAMLLLTVGSFAQQYYTPDVYHDLGDISDKVLIGDTQFLPDGRMIETLPYNKKKHSVAEHARFIANSYALMLGLSRRQNCQLYNEILGIYQTPNPALAYTQSDRERQIIEACRVHNAIAIWLKSTLSPDKFLAYRKWVNYPENIFARGW